MHRFELLKYNQPVILLGAVNECNDSAYVRYFYSQTVDYAQQLNTVSREFITNISPKKIKRLLEGEKRCSSTINEQSPDGVSSRPTRPPIW